MITGEGVLTGSGHLSARIPGTDTFLINPRFAGVLADPKDICTVTFDGKRVAGKGPIPSESPIHAAVYRARPDVGSVIHCHARYSILVGRLDQGLVPFNREARNICRRGSRVSRQPRINAEALTYFPDMRTYNLGPDSYLEHVRRAKAAVDIPVIASLNGVSSGGWISYAQLMEEAGADAIELNVYFIPTDPVMTAAHVEQMYVDLAADVKRSVHVPVAVKLGHFFTALANLAQRIDGTGVDGLTLFNRFYQPDFDLEALEVVPSLTQSSSYEILLRLHWVAILFGHVRADLAVTGGVHSGEDVLKAMMAGARTAMMTSALLTRGVEHLATVLAEVRA